MPSLQCQQFVKNKPEHMHTQEGLTAYKQETTHSNRMYIYKQIYCTAQLFAPLKHKALHLSPRSAAAFCVY
jgi:hypothetical protein